MRLVVYALGWLHSHLVDYAIVCLLNVRLVHCAISWLCSWLYVHLVHCAIGCWLLVVRLVGCAFGRLCVWFFLRLVVSALGCLCAWLIMRLVGWWMCV